MSQAPSMPLFTDALIGDTLDLTMEEFGAYCMILFATWSRGKPLPDDPVVLARICRISTRKWLSFLRQKVIGFFDVSDGFLHQKRLEKEWAYVVQHREKQRQNGMKGGRPRAAAENPPVSQAKAPNPNPNPIRKDLHPHHPPESAPARPSVGTRRCPDGQRDEEEVEVLLKEFQLFWEAYPRKLNYRRAFAAFVTARKTESLETLIAAAERYAASASSTESRYVAWPETWLANQRWLDEPDPDEGADAYVDQESAENWRIRMGVWFSKPRDPKTWCEVAWGPPIGDPDCRVPIEILAEFGLPPGRDD